MLEKSRVVRVRGGELPYHIFTYILHGADSVTKQELQLHANSAAECPYYKNSQVNNLMFILLRVKYIRFLDSLTGS